MTPRSAPTAGTREDTLRGMPTFTSATTTRAGLVPVRLNEVNLRITPIRITHTQGEMGAQGRTTFMVDSTYAINMATGRTVPNSGKGSTNRLLAIRLRIAYRLLQHERGDNVSIQHVKSAHRDQR